MTLKQYIEKTIPNVIYSYAYGDVYECASPEQTMEIMMEICRFYQSYPDKSVNTGTYMVLDDENDVYKVIVRDI